MIIKKEYQKLIAMNPVTLKGNYENRKIWLNDFELNPVLSKKIYVHSESGFDWGNTDSGSAQLALAILLELTGNKKLTMILHHAFKNDHIANLRKGDFEEIINIGAWFYNNISNDYIL
jgi:hypothetical protein